MWQCKREDLLEEQGVVKKRVRTQRQQTSSRFQKSYFISKRGSKWSVERTVGEQMHAQELKRKWERIKVKRWNCQAKTEEEVALILITLWSANMQLWIPTKLKKQHFLDLMKAKWQWGRVYYIVTHRIMVNNAYGEKTGTAEMDYLPSRSRENVTREPNRKEPWGFSLPLLPCLAPRQPESTSTF